MRGVVYKSTGSWYWVKEKDTGEFFHCRLKGKIRLNASGNTNPIAVGDVVDFFPEKGKTEQGIIEHILPRENYIIRKSVNLSKQTHIIAANIDYAFLMITLNNPPTSSVFIDRFLITAQAYNITAILLFNKIDTYNEEELLQVKYWASMYREIGYQCLGISTKTGKNITQVKELMSGKTSVIAGHSGVGKSSLINAISPNLQLTTAEISAQHKQGQHTTTFAQMYDLDFSGRIIDTPGIRGFGVVAMEKDEISDYFPEFLALKDGCKFNNCLHTDEPSCAIKKALEEDKIHWSRYKSYLQILEDKGDNYRYTQE